MGESIVIDVDEKFDDVNQVNIRKLYCDVYAETSKKEPERASYYAINAVFEYMKVFKPELKKVKPQ